MVNAALFVVLLGLTGYLIVGRMTQLWYSRNAVGLVGELYYPVVIFLVYGVFALPLLVKPASAFESYVGVDFEGLTLAYTLLLVLLGALCHFIGFDLTYRRETKHSAASTFVQVSTDRGFAFTVTLLAAFDILVRFQRISVGQYFDWMRARAADLFGGGQNALWMLQDGLMPILVAAAYHRSQKNRAWMIYLVALLLLVVLEGKRMKIASAILSLILVRLFLFPTRPSLKKMIAVVILAGAGAHVGSTAVYEMRTVYRADTLNAVSDPVTFIKMMAFETLPRALTNIGGLDDTDALRGAGLMERVSSWPISLTSAVASVRESGYLPAEYFWDELALAIPSALYIGEKPSNDISTIIASYYDLFPPGSRSESADLANIAYLNSYAYFGLLGLATYALGIGALIGLTFRFLVQRFGVNGILIVFGTTYFLKLQSNSLAGPITGLRNIWILIAIFVVIQLLVNFSANYRMAARGVPR